MLLTLLFVTSAFAQQNCYSNGVYHPLESLSPLVEKANVYSDTDRRETLDKYAESHHMDPVEVDAKLAATGKIVCGESTGTAQITLKSNIITTAAHVLINEKNCAPFSKPEECKFTYTFMGQENTIPVDSAAHMGSSCPSPSLPDSDWAVLKLKSPAPGAIPYRIDPAKVKNLVPPAKVIHVAALSADFCVRNPKTKRCLIDKKTKSFIRPEHVEDCTIFKAYGILQSFSSDCASSAGASGGSVLDSDLTYPTLLAMTVGGSGDQAMYDDAVKNGTIYKRPYEAGVWEAKHVPVAGRFLAAIQDAASN